MDTNLSVPLVDNAFLTFGNLIVGSSTELNAIELKISIKAFKVYLLKCLLRAKVIKSLEAYRSW